MTKKATLTFLNSDTKILLKMALRGPSKGKWNGVGGWMEPYDSTLDDSSRREIFEETGLTVNNLFYHGDMRVYMDGSATPNVTVYMYSSSDFSGDMIQSPEGELKWFPIDNIPYAEMLDDNKYCIPLILRKERFDIELSVRKAGHVYVGHKIIFPSKDI